MHVFSYHLVKVSFLSAINIALFPQKLNKISGLIHAEVMQVMTLGSPILSFKRMLFRQIAIFAQWENEAAIDTFLAKDKFGKLIAKGWHIRLQFLRQWGSISDFDIPKDGVDSESLAETPVVAVTIARMKLPEVPRFIQWGRPVEKLVRDHPGTTLSLASIRLPRTISTFSIWKSQQAMKDMVSGHSAVPQPQRHRQAMKERDRKDFHFEFTTLRFLPIAEFGRWKGQSQFIPQQKMHS